MFVNLINFSSEIKQTSNRKRESLKKSLLLELSIKFKVDAHKSNYLRGGGEGRELLRHRSTPPALPRLNATTIPQQGEVLLGAHALDSVRVGV